MQLASKMRYIASQFDAFLSNDLWRINAAHANKMALKLYNAVKDIDGVEITQKVESNAVFAKIPHELIPVLQEKVFWNHLFHCERNVVAVLQRLRQQVQRVVPFRLRRRQQ